MTMTTPRAERWRVALRWLLATAFFLAGLWHLSLPPAMLRITPDWVPDKPAVITATGVCELFGAVGLLIPRTRWWAGVMLAAYAVCVYPANVKHAMLHASMGMPPGWGYHVPRLLFQPVIVWWALFAGCVTDWPFGRRGVNAAPLPRSP